MATTDKVQLFLAAFALAGVVVNVVTWSIYGIVCLRSGRE